MLTHGKQLGFFVSSQIFLIVAASNRQHAANRPGRGSAPQAQIQGLPLIILDIVHRFGEYTPDLTKTSTSLGWLSLSKDIR
jgi:hypothetical protein